MDHKFFGKFAFLAKQSKHVRSSHRSDSKLKIIHGNFFYAVEWVILISRFLRPNTGKLGQIPVEIFRFLNSICHNLTSQFDNKRFQDDFSSHDCDHAWSITKHGVIQVESVLDMQNNWQVLHDDAWLSFLRLAMNLSKYLHHNSSTNQCNSFSAIAFLWSYSMSSFKLSRGLQSFVSSSLLHNIFSATP